MIKLANSSYLEGLFKEYDTVSIHVYDGCWIETIFVPKIGPHEGKELTLSIGVHLNLERNSTSVHFEDGQNMTLTRGTIKAFGNSDGNWKEKRVNWK